MANFAATPQNVSMAKVKTRFKDGPPRHFIKQWRVHRGLTLERLAERVGVTHGAIQQLENGKTNYTQPMLEALAGALQTTPAALITIDPGSRNYSLYEKIESLPQEQRASVEAIIDGLRKAS